MPGFAVATFASLAAGQYLVSIRSATLSFIYGDVFVSRRASTGPGPPVFNPTRPLELRSGDQIETRVGVAEILLGPGANVRLGGDTRIKLQSADFADTRLNVIAGSAILEYAEYNPARRISVIVGPVEAVLLAEGVYRFDASADWVRVYLGRAQIARGGQTLVLKSGAQTRVRFGPLAAWTFRPDFDEPLFFWASNRSNEFAAANCNVGSASHLGQRKCRQFIGPFQRLTRPWRRP